MYEMKTYWNVNPSGAGAGIILDFISGSIFVRMNEAANNWYRLFIFKYFSLKWLLWVILLLLLPTGLLQISGHYTSWKSFVPRQLLYIAIHSLSELYDRNIKLLPTFGPFINNNSIMLIDTQSKRHEFVKPRYVLSGCQLTIKNIWVAQCLNRVESAFVSIITANVQYPKLEVPIHIMISRPKQLHGLI